MKKIRVITAFPHNPEHVLRKIDDFKSYELEDVEISLSHNELGSIHGQTDVEHEFAKPGMAQQAINAEKEGIDAVVIESMGDTGLMACREVVKIPVIGMADSSMRIAGMLGRNFGLITVGKWHGYALERLTHLYGVNQNYVGFESIDLQPFFVDAISQIDIETKLFDAAMRLIKTKDVDVIVCGGSYFMNCGKKLENRLLSEDYYIPVIDPLPLAIHFARTLIYSELSHSKKIYAEPKHKTKIIGYKGISHTPGTPD